MINHEQIIFWSELNTRINLDFDLEPRKGLDFNLNPKYLNQIYCLSDLLMFDQIDFN